MGDAFDVLDAVGRGAKAFFKEATKPKGFVSGERFESFVKKMFPEAEWILVKQTQNYLSNKDRYEEKSMEPDFLFRHIKSGRLVSIECKFRTGMVDGDRIEWCKPYQFNRYKELDQKYGNVYIVLGFGGSSTSPEKVFRFPLSEVKYNAVFLSYIAKYEVSTDHSFTLWDGQLR
jgi:hypothetical protein